MLIHILIQTSLAIIRVVTFWLPDASFLPFGIDAVLVSGFGYVHYLALIFPPITIALAFMYWLIWWKLGIKLLSLIPIIRHVVK
jgi:hypothetical protein